MYSSKLVNLLARYLCMYVCMFLCPNYVAFSRRPKQSHIFSRFKEQLPSLAVKEGVATMESIK